MPNKNKNCLYTSSMCLNGACIGDGIIPGPNMLFMNFSAMLIAAIASRLQEHIINRSLKGTALTYYDTIRSTNLKATVLKHRRACDSASFFSTLKDLWDRISIIGIIPESKKGEKIK